MATKVRVFSVNCLNDNVAGGCQVAKKLSTFFNVPSHMVPGENRSVFPKKPKQSLYSRVLTYFQ